MCYQERKLRNLRNFVIVIFNDLLETNFIDVLVSLSPVINQELKAICSY